MLLLALAATAQEVSIDITPGHATNSISPLRALGAGIDRDPFDSVKTIFSHDEVQEMLSAGWGSVSYRLNTELGAQAWHWNPKGTWSDPAGEGYFVGTPDTSRLDLSFIRLLPPTQRDEPVIPWLLRNR